MARIYRLSRQAESDLHEIAHYILRESPASVRRVVAALRRAFRDLADNPELGMLRHDLHPDLRLFVPPKPAQNYLIFYYSTTEGIEVSTVIHGARDWETMFDRGER